MSSWWACELNSLPNYSPVQANTHHTTTNRNTSLTNLKKLSEYYQLYSLIPPFYHHITVNANLLKRYSERPSKTCINLCLFITQYLISIYCKKIMLKIFPKYSPIPTFSITQQPILRYCRADTSTSFLFIFWPSKSDVDFECGNRTILIFG